MTELSYLWDGIITGDATLAPYDKAEFNRYIMGAMVEDSTQAFVIPGYLNDLEVTSNGNHSISIAAGAALLHQYLYINNTALTLNIDLPPTTSHLRYDFVVLRLDTATQKLRLAIIKGIATTDYTTLEDPTLIQSDPIWELPIAKILIEGSESYIISNYIYDQRKFAVTPYSTIAFDNNYGGNLLLNSEFMAWAESANVFPDKWNISGFVFVPVAAAKTSLMSRGQTVQLTTLGGWGQTVPINTSVHTYTLKGTFTEITGGANSTPYISLYVVYEDGTTRSKTQAFKYLSSNIEVEFQFTLHLPESDLKVKWITISMYKVGAIGGETHYGQMLLVPGYHPGPFRQITEIIPFEDAIADAAWADTAKSTGTTAIDFTADFNAEVLPQTKAVILRLRGRDSASLAGSPYMQILGFNATYPGPYGRLWLEGVPNNIYREMVVIAPVNQDMWAGDSQVPQLRIDVVATGAGTFDATVEVIGIII